MSDEKNIEERYKKFYEDLKWNQEEMNRLRNLGENTMNILNSDQGISFSADDMAILEEILSTESPKQQSESTVSKARTVDGTLARKVKPGESVRNNSTQKSRIPRWSRKQQPTYTVTQTKSVAKNKQQGVKSTTSGHRVEDKRELPKEELTSIKAFARMAMSRVTTKSVNDVENRMQQEKDKIQQLNIEFTNLLEDAPQTTRTSSEMDTSKRTEFASDMDDFLR